jgi:hypothetical protein
MTTILSGIVAFYKKHRLPIIMGLVVVAVLQWCQIQSDKKFRKAPENAAVEQTISAPEVAPPVMVTPKQQWLPYLLMVAMVLLVFVAQRRGWLVKLFPRVVVLRCTPFKLNGQRALRIFFMNAKRENVVFDEPIVDFLWFGKKKSFKLSLKSGNITFPLTMTPSTAHSMVVDLGKIHAISPETKKALFLRVSMTVNGKTMRSFPRLFL